MGELDFSRMKSRGLSPFDAATVAKAAGVSHLETFKGIYDHWGSGPFTIGELEKHGDGQFPTPSARAAATVGLAALILNYPKATAGDVARFELVTGISRKVVALARAGRADDALGFYDRLEPDRLALRPISEVEARRTVGLAVGEHRGWLRVDDAATTTHDWGWLYHYQSAAFLDTGDPACHVSGTAPIIVDRFTGALIETGDPSESPATYGERYEATGWPTPQRT